MFFLFGTCRTQVLFDCIIILALAHKIIKAHKTGCIVFLINRKKLKQIQTQFDRRTADYHGEDIWDLSVFLMLLNIADHEKMGKSKTVIYAYKIGFIEGRWNTLDKIKKYLAKQNPILA